MKAIEKETTGIKRFIGRILPGGRLSLPGSMKGEVGKTYEVVMLPADGVNLFKHAEKLARKKRIGRLSDKDIERIVHESRGIRQ